MSQTSTFIPPAPLKTAVLFIVFNRPEVTARVFDAIRQAKPPRLYVAADGPRPNRPGEAERCAEVRRIATSVDWPCEVKTLFRQSNLGCKLGVSGGINWFFENEEEGLFGVFLRRNGMTDIAEMLHLSGVTKTLGGTAYGSSHSGEDFGT